MEESPSCKRGGGGLWHVIEMAKKHNKLTMRGSSGLRCRFNSLMVVIIVTFIIVFVSITTKNDDGRNRFWHDATTVFPGAAEAETCDLFAGKWVFDNLTYPLYSERRCKFMSDQSACEKFGRENLRYQNWRWKPHGCDLPRYSC